MPQSWRAHAVALVGYATVAIVFLAPLLAITALINVAFLVGHNDVRREVMGMSDKAPTPSQLAQMKALVANAMRDAVSKFDWIADSVAIAIRMSDATRNVNECCQAFGMRIALRDVVHA